MQIEKKRVYMPIWLALALIMLAVIILMASGCSLDMFKAKSRQTSAVNTVKKDSSGSVDSSGGVSKKTSNTKTSEEFDWKRFIAEFPRDTGTTIINNNTYPQPTRLIFEQGSGKKDQQTTTTDSTAYYSLLKIWQASFDSLSARLDRSEKNKESHYSGPGLLTLILIGLGIALLPQLLTFFKSFSITKKSTQ